MAADEDQLRLRLRRDFDVPGLIDVQDVVLKNGPQAWKTAALLSFGNETTGQVRRRTLRVQTWVRSPSGTYGFEQKADYRWSCDNDEINTLSMLLTTQLPAAGTYEVVNESSPTAAISRLLAGDAGVAAQAVAELLAVPAVRDALVDSGAAAAGADLVNARRQRTALDRLSNAVMRPETNERDLQQALSGEWWLFGGRFLGQYSRRMLTSLDQLDIPLLRADGSLHIVELKRANIPKLVIKHRSHLVPGEEVHLAASQAMNYLRALDEEAALIRQNFGVDVRRAAATVVIGHPNYCPFDDEAVMQTLRTYSGHLARLEIITYAELLAGASAALNAAVSEEARPDSDRDGDSAGRAMVSDEPPPDPIGSEWGDSEHWATAEDPWGQNDSDAEDPWAAAPDEPPF